MVDDELELGPGLNVISGPNESGKSSWHAALYAALCGVRRARGSPRREDKEFSDRHKPWNSSKWQASAILNLADGRRIEIHQDLANLVDCRATDLAFGRDVSASIMNDGTPDASRWLGLDRTSFLSVACVRQAEVLAVAEKESADGLQAALQRAAASVPAETTASAAIARLADFSTNQIGTDRAPTKPLRMAASRVEMAMANLARAEGEHREFLELSRDVDLAGAVARRARARVHAAMAANAATDVNRLRRRFEEAQQLQAEFPAGEPPLPSTDEEEARTIASLLDRWRNNREIAPLDGESAEQLGIQLAAARAQADGDIEVHPAVREAWEKWTGLGTLLAQRDRERPQPVDAPDTGGYSLEELYASADELAAAALPPLAAPAAASPIWWVAAGVVAVLAIISMALALVVPAVALFAVAATLAGVRVMLARRPTQPAPGDIAEHLRADLRQLQLPTSPAELRQLALAVSASQQRVGEIAVWAARRGAIETDQQVARRELLAQLRARGIAVDDESDPNTAFHQYDANCRFRRDRSGQLQALAAQVPAREQAERLVATSREERRTLELRLREAAALAGVATNGEDPEMLAGTLDDWLMRRDNRLNELDGQRRRWVRLEGLLDGLTLAELEASTRDAETRAADLARRVPDPASNEPMAHIGSATGEEELDLLRHAEQESSGRLAALSERLQERALKMRSVAADREELVAAEAEQQRLLSLAEVLRLTREFMESAVERAHRSIAPVLEASITSRLAAVTNGRYVEALVDPETLAVRVRGKGANWREAQKLSHGTTEQIYFMLRIALAEHLVKAGEIAPLIFDDATVHSDQERTVAVMETLLTLAERRQVVVFTQESEVAEWAKARLVGRAHRCIELAEIPAGR